ncbi:MAG: hypothetical protein OXR67_01675 [Chloroflexota bacterium]|nr:hypothetical protein [Chloroflexota bacterium]
MVNEVKTILQIACLGALLIVLVITGVTLYRFNIVLEDFRQSLVYQVAGSVGYSGLESPDSDAMQEKVEELMPTAVGDSDSQPRSVVEDLGRIAELELSSIGNGTAETEPDEAISGDESQAIPNESEVVTPAVEIDTGNICNRTPEIQQRLIEMLQITSCRDITGEELVRVRNLELGRMPLKVGDLDGFINLTSLTLLAEDAPVGLFDDLVNLKTLELGIEKPPSPGLFQNLTSLEQMELFIEAEDDDRDIALPGVFEGLTALIYLELAVSDRSNNYAVPLRQGSLIGMPNLQALVVSNASRVESGTLHDLPDLRSANLRAIGLPEHLSRPSLPSDLFAGNPDLEIIGFSGFGEVSRLDFNSLDVICRMQRNMDLRYGVGFAAVVQDEVVEVIDYDWDDENLACTLRVAPFGTEDWDEVKINVPPLPEYRRS